MLWKDGYFSPSDWGEKSTLYHSRLDWPLITNVLNGVAKKPDWPLHTGEHASSALFRRIKPLVVEHGASWVYITDPDNSLSLSHWERVVDPQFLNDTVLSEFETNRAQQGGVSYLVLVLHSHAGILVFEVDDALDVSCYGSAAFCARVRADFGA